MNKPHKHKDVMIAAANGAIVQFNSPEGWVDIDNPCYVDTCEYRVKPEREWPATSLSDSFLAVTYNSKQFSDVASALRGIDNAAIKQYIIDSEK